MKTMPITRDILVFVGLMSIVNCFTDLKEISKCNSDCNFF